MRFAAFGDSALEARLNRLTRAEADLQVRLQERIGEAENEGRWVPSDPIYQRLSGVLRQVRKDLSETQSEHAKRRARASQHERAAA